MGACIFHWKIDPRPDFQAVVCTHAWLGLDHAGNRVSNPPERQFQDGEFSSRYQQIADIIEFVVHRRIELDALVVAIEQSKAMRADRLQVQNLAQAQQTISLLSSQNGSLQELSRNRQPTLTVFNSVANYMDNSKRITNMIGNTVSQASQIVQSDALW